MVIYGDSDCSVVVYWMQYRDVVSDGRCDSCRYLLGLQCRDMVVGFQCIGLQHLCFVCRRVLFDVDRANVSCVMSQLQCRDVVQYRFVVHVYGLRGLQCRYMVSNIWCVVADNMSYLQHRYILHCVVVVLLYL